MAAAAAVTAGRAEILEILSLRGCLQGMWAGSNGPPALSPAQPAPLCAAGSPVLSEPWLRAGRGPSSQTHSQLLLRAGAPPGPSRGCCLSPCPTPAFPGSHSSSPSGCRHSPLGAKQDLISLAGPLWRTRLGVRGCSALSDRRLRRPLGVRQGSTQNHSGLSASDSLGQPPQASATWDQVAHRASEERPLLSEWAGEQGSAWGDLRQGQALSCLGQ